MPKIALLRTKTIYGTCLRPEARHGVVEVLKGGGPNGTVSFLGSLISNTSSSKYDHCSSYVNEIVEVRDTGQKKLPMAKMGSEDLISIYTDGAELLRAKRSFAVF